MATAILNHKLDACWRITAGAWLMLVAITFSGYAPYLNHGDWTLAGVLADICGINLAEEGIIGALALLASWLLMLAAMMGPVAFSSLKHNQKISYMAVLGYAIIWSVVGIALHGFGYVLQLAARNSDWFYFNGWSIGASTLLIIGLFQFSRLKSAPTSICSLCRAGVSQSQFTLGLRHGVDCARCCGLLMCLMFVFFPGNLFWMAIITVLILLDRGMFGLPALRQEIGVALIVAACTLTVAQSI
ncbi:DUF2182 domain-containing protein [Sulfitobacter sp.]|uniref:DUF2182 domain-containing protein n=1 Tax=Sulfitobacter sp. TaxID=1903071 RepID=UPI00329A4FDF